MSREEAHCDRRRNTHMHIHIGRLSRTSSRIYLMPLTSSSHHHHHRRVECTLNWNSIIAYCWHTFSIILVFIWEREWVRGWFRCQFKERPVWKRRCAPCCVWVWDASVTAPLHSAVSSTSCDLRCHPDAILKESRTFPTNPPGPVSSLYCLYVRQSSCGGGRLSSRHADR